MNDLLDCLKTCKTDEEIKEIVDFFISEYVEESKELNNGNHSIGRELELNPVKKFNHLEFEIPNVVNRWEGYIPLGTKIIYGTRVNPDGPTVCNGGSYYYMDDESYLYEFAKFIKDNPINDRIVFINYVDAFIHKYFDNNLNPFDRCVMHTCFYKPDGTKMPPVKEHGISDFKGRGAAVCTEYTVTAQNILTIFGLRSEAIFGKQHAYNIFYDIDGEVDILDFKSRIKMFNIKANLVKYAPFLEAIDEFSDEWYDDFLHHNVKYRFDDYEVTMVGRCPKIVTTDLIRVYDADGQLMALAAKEKEAENPKLILEKHL